MSIDNEGLGLPLNDLLALADGRQLREGTVQVLQYKQRYKQVNIQNRKDSVRQLMVGKWSKEVHDGCVASLTWYFITKELLPRVIRAQHS